MISSLNRHTESGTDIYRTRGRENGIIFIWCERRRILSMQAVHFAAANPNVAAKTVFSHTGRTRYFRMQLVLTGMVPRNWQKIEILPNSLLRICQMLKLTKQWSVYLRDAQGRFMGISSITAVWCCYDRKMQPPKPSVITDFINDPKSNLLLLYWGIY